jgi:rhodanese-related sulfurtransferase
MWSSIQIILLAAGAIMLTGCRVKENQPTSAQLPPSAEYRAITPQEAKALMQADPAVVLVDVRTPAEYAEKRIPKSILIPDYELASKAPALLPKKDATIILYCRSGRRSHQAALALMGLGYTRILDLGGIISWPYETASGT